MPNFTYTVTDDNTGQPLGGAAWYDNISTSCCNCLGSCSGCNGCTSGEGWSANGNTDPNTGVGTTDAKYTCPMNHIIKVTAPGYYDTTVQPSNGNLALDQVYNFDIQMTPLPNVSQTNQGAGGDALYGQQTTSVGASGAANTLGNAITNPLTGAEVDIALVAIAIVAVVIIALFFLI